MIKNVQVLKLNKFESRKNGKEYYTISVYFEDYNLLNNYFISESYYHELIKLDPKTIIVDNCFSLGSRNNDLVVIFNEKNIKKKGE